MGEPPAWTVRAFFGGLCETTRYGDHLAVAFDAAKSAGEDLGHTFDGFKAYYHGHLALEAWQDRGIVHLDLKRSSPPPISKGTP